MNKFETVAAVAGLKDLELLKLARRRLIAGSRGFAAATLPQRICPARARDVA